MLDTADATDRLVITISRCLRLAEASMGAFET